MVSLEARYKAHSGIVSARWMDAMAVLVEWGAGMSIEGACLTVGKGLSTRQIWWYAGRKRWARMRLAHRRSVEEQQEPDLVCPTCRWGKPRDRERCFSCFLRQDMRRPDRHAAALRGLAAINARRQAR